MIRFVDVELPKPAVPAKDRGARLKAVRKAMAESKPRKPAKAKRRAKVS